MGTICSSDLNAADYPPVVRAFRTATNCDKQTVKEADRYRTVQVMSYNVLADGLATQNMHSHASEKELAFEFRAPRVIQEISQSNAGIVCFQELNRIEDYYEAELKRLGFQLIRHKQANTNIWFQ